MSMNLGEARLSRVPSSQPQLSRAESRQSVAASDDYYSISEGSNSTDRETVVRYQTPPPRTGSADSAHSQNTTKRADHLPTHQEVIEPPTPVATRQVSTQQGKTWRDPHVDASAPTPGLDDSPYIQFAIDQITRDEEVSGKNRESRDSRVASMAPAVPVAALLNEPQRQSRVVSSKYSSGPTDSAVPEPVSPISEHERHSTEEKPNYPYNLEAPQTSQLFPPLVSREERARAILVPATPRTTDYRYPPLNFVPGPLRLLPLLALMVFCLGLLVILVISTVFGAKNYGLLGYEGVGTARYFIFQYLPQLLAAIVVVWLMVIQTAIQRILPFVLLARAHGYPDEDVFENVPIYVTNYLWPNTSLLRRGVALKFCAIVFWITLFTIPLASSLYQTRWYEQVGNGSFLWTTVQPVSLALIGLYTLLMIALVITYIEFNRKITGLKCDPISLADIIVLLRRTSNLTSSRTSKITRNSSVRPHSLGYWESTSRPGAIFHGIGAANEPPLGNGDRDSIDDVEARIPVQQSTFESWHSHHWTGNRTQPAFLRESLLIFYSVAALALLIAFLVVTYLKSELLRGFLPLLPTATAQTSSFTSFSPANFVYSFVPSFVGLLLALFWAPIDTAFRYLRPWSTLSKHYPASASKSFGHTSLSTLLLSYTAALPFSTTIRALSHGHLRIAWFSFLALLSWAIPILGGGIFTAQYVTTSPNDRGLTDQARGGDILIRPDPAALYALTAIVVVYALSWLLVLPGAKGRAITGPDGRPVDVRYLAGIRSVVDKSVLRESTWVEPRSRIDLRTRLVASETAKGRGSGRWAMAGGRIVRA